MGPRHARQSRPPIQRSSLQRLRRGCSPGCRHGVTSLQRFREALGAVLPTAACLILVGALGRLWWDRLSYPFDLEWMEGGHAGPRLAPVSRGLPLYQSPPTPTSCRSSTPRATPRCSRPSGELVRAGPRPSGRAISLAGIDLQPPPVRSAFAVRGRGGAPADRPRVGRVPRSWGPTPQAGAFYDLVRPDSLALALLGLEPRDGGLSAVPGAPRWRRGCCSPLRSLVKHNTALFGSADRPRAAGRPPTARHGVAVRPRGSWCPAAAPWSPCSRSGATGRLLTYLLEVPAGAPDAVGAGPYVDTVWELGNAHAGRRSRWCGAGRAGRGAFRPVRDPARGSRRPFPAWCGIGARAGAGTYNPPPDPETEPAADPLRGWPTGACPPLPSGRSSPASPAWGSPCGDRWRGDQQGPSSWRAIYWPGFGIGAVAGQRPRC